MGVMLYSMWMNTLYFLKAVHFSKRKPIFHVDKWKKFC